MLINTIASVLNDADAGGETVGGGEDDDELLNDEDWLLQKKEVK